MSLWWLALTIFGILLGIGLLLFACVAVDEFDGPSPILIFILAFIVLFSGIVFTVVVPTQHVSQRNCAYTGEQLNRNTRWDFWAGCYIQLKDGRYVKESVYRAFLEDK